MVNQQIQKKPPFSMALCFVAICLWWHWFCGNLDLPADIAGAVEIHGAKSSDSETDDEIDEKTKEQR